MNIEQIYKKAESNSPHLVAPDYIKISISSLSDNTATPVIYGSLQDEIFKQGFKAQVIITGSSGYYDLEPILLVEKPGQYALLFKNVNEIKASRILHQCLEDRVSQNDSIVCNFGPNNLEGIPDASDIPLFNLQRRISLRNCGLLNPKDINQYILRDNGYRGLAECLKLDSVGIIEELNNSELRGRGGAGFNTAQKWQICRDTAGCEKYVICNAIDADPHAFTARLLLESDPHSVLEGILIGAFAVGATRCFICLNDDYPAAFDVLNTALQQMRAYNLLGTGILDSAFNCEIELKTMPRLLVSGEETALLSRLMGKQPMPYLRTHYPATRGYLDKPTLINNAETFSNVSAIFQEGANWFAGTGTEKSKGTKIISLAGETAHKYTIEVPFGTTLRNIVSDISAIPEGKNLKAVQFGGPTGAFYDTGSLDIPIDYETFKDSGSIMGSGTLKIITEDSCAVAMTKDIISYLQTQSCGKCVFCREGTYQMFDILKDIETTGGKTPDIDLLVELGEVMKVGSICALGKTAPGLVLSSLKCFRRDFDLHIKEGKCPYKLEM